MSEAGHGLTSSLDVERLLADALRPIEPPERLSGRFEDTLSAVIALAVFLPLVVVLTSGWVMFHMGDDVKILAMLAAGDLEPDHIEGGARGQE